MSATGNRGRFSDRLKKISMRKRQKNIKLPEDDDTTFKNWYVNLAKVIAAVPGVIYDSVRENKKQSNNSVKLDNGDTNTIPRKYEIGNGFGNRRLKNRNVEFIKDINVYSIKKSQDLFYKGKNNSSNTSLDNVNSSSSVSSNNYSNVQDLEKEIINIIKKNLMRTVNEMEILQSDLYVLSKLDGNSKTVKEVQRQLSEVKKLLSKIDRLKEKYDFLRDNYDFEYLLEVDDNELVSKIIELKNSFSNNEVRALVQDYKLLDVYKYLYLKIDDLQEKTADYEKYKNDSLIELKQRDIDFNKFKNEVYDVEDSKRKYDFFVDQQNELLKKIEDDVSRIDSHEVVKYRLKGFGHVFSSAFKYFGLLVATPLRGLIPSIATETIITANMLRNMRHNLHWEEYKKTVYEAIDYSTLLNNAISDLDLTSSIVDRTLEDIVNLKMEYNNKFKKYNGDILEYREIMYKINYMENQIMGNKIKIETLKKKALDQKQQNVKKLVLLDKLNSKQDNN